MVIETSTYNYSFRKLSIGIFREVFNVCPGGAGIRGIAECFQDARGVLLDLEILPCSCSPSSVFIYLMKNLSDQKPKPRRRALPLRSHNYEYTPLPRLGSSYEVFQLSSKRARAFSLCQATHTSSRFEPCIFTDFGFSIEEKPNQPPYSSRQIVP